MNSKTRPLTLCRIPKTLTCKTCLFFLFFLELNFSFFRHFVYLHLSHISYPVLLTLFLFAVAAILNTSPSSLETRDLLCARVFSRAAAILKSEKTLGTRLWKGLPERSFLVSYYRKLTIVLMRVFKINAT